MRNFAMLGSIVLVASLVACGGDVDAPSTTTATGSGGEGGAGGDGGTGGSGGDSGEMTCDDPNTWAPADPNPMYTVTDPAAATAYFEPLCLKWKAAADAMNAECKGQMVDGAPFILEDAEVVCSNPAQAWLCTDVGSAEWNAWIVTVTGAMCNVIF